MVIVFHETEHTLCNYSGSPWVSWALKDLQLMPDLVSLNLEPLYDVIMSPCFHGNEMVFR